MSKVRLLLFVSALALFAGCSKMPAINPEVAMPPDVDVVVALEHTDPEQMRAVEKFVKFLPKKSRDKWVSFLDEMMLQSEGISFSDSFLPHLEGRWKLVFAYRSNTPKTEVDALLRDENMEMFSAVWVERPDTFERMLVGTDDPTIEPHTTDEGVAYWFDTKAKMYLMRRDNVFLMTATLDMLQEMQGHLAAGSGFGATEQKAKIDRISDTRIGYFYIASLGNYYGVMKAERDGIRVLSDSVMLPDGPQYLVEYEPKMFKKLPGDDVVFYAEQGNSLVMSEAFLSSFYQSLARLTPEKSVKAASVSERFGAFAGVTAEEAREFLSSPSALVASDFGGYYPALGMYLQLSQETALTGKKFAVALDGYFDSTLVEVDGLLGENAGRGAIKREVVMVKGAALHALYLDWESLPRELQVRLGAIPQIYGTPVRFYYGVTHDDVFVMALHPQFEEVYGGRKVVARDGAFGKAFTEVSLADQDAISFGNLKPLLAIFQRFVDLGSSYGLSAEDQVPAHFMDLLRIFGPFSGASDVQGDRIYGEQFFRLLKVVR